MANTSLNEQMTISYGSRNSEDSHAIQSINTCFKQKVEPGWCFTGEAHPFWEMLYVSEGCVYASEEERVYKLSAGDMIFHAPMEFHKLWCENGPHAKFTVISFCTDEPLLTPLSKDVINIDIETQTALGEVYSSILENFNVNVYVATKNESARNIVGERLAFLKLEMFLYSLLPETKNPTARQYTAGAKNYQLIIDTMNEHINENLTIEELANYCSMSTSNLKKIFAKYGDGGVMHYFARMKIQRAIRYLKHGSPIEAVGQNLGFKSHSHFSVVFKRFAGITPSEFKKQGFNPSTIKL